MKNITRTMAIILIAALCALGAAWAEAPAVTASDYPGEWNEERVSILIVETAEDYQVIVAGSSGATEGAMWIYSCDFDAATGSLVSNGGIAEKTVYSLGEDGEGYTEEVVYEDGEAVFSLNADGMLIWDDRKENEGEGRLFERGEALGAVIEPMDPGCDADALTDGAYPAAFLPDALADGALTFTVYSEDVYDIVDISRIAEGDILVVGGEPCAVKSVERGEDVLINGGLDNGGFTLCAFDEDNCWRVVLEDDHNTYTERGEATLPLAEDATFTDGWDIEKGPVTVGGAEAVAAAINGAEMEFFDELNTTVRVEDGRIVEIIRNYMP